jgi:catechol 2,3-dioxygenase
MANLHGVRIERVDLRVSDAKRAQDYWSTLTATPARDGALLDSAGRELIAFGDEGVSGAAPPRAAGLFHVALRFGTRAALGAALRRVAEAGLRLTGASDHGVSEALYLRDPDGLGVELYWDRPREVWPDQMFTAPLDLEPILAGADDDGSAVDVGHVHLQASNLDDSTAFWRSHVGLDLSNTMPQASFLSADGYHHHIGLNTWNSAGAPPAPDDRPGLSRIVLSAAGAGDGVELDTPEGLLVAVVPTKS